MGEKDAAVEEGEEGLENLTILIIWTARPVIGRALGRIA